MKPRLRSIVLLLLTLVIGIVIGGLTSGLLHQKRDKRFHFMRSEESFVRTLTEVIAPTDEAQAAAVEATLHDATEGIFRPVREGFRESRQAIERLQDDLATILGEDQHARVVDKLRRPGRPKRESKKEGEAVENGSNGS
jgi:hypothetical protein